MRKNWRIRPVLFWLFFGLLQPSTDECFVTRRHLHEKSQHSFLKITGHKMRPLMMVEGIDTTDFLDGFSIWKRVFEEVQDASTPRDISSLIAVSGAETFAGGIGGLVSRQIALLIGDTERDMALSKAASTGLFFGARGVVLALCTLLGISRPLAIVLGSYFGSFVSEEIKLIYRSLSMQRGFNSTPEPTLSLREALGDVAKWLVYDISVSSLGNLLPYNYFQCCLVYFSLGSTASMVSYLVKKIPVEPSLAMKDLWKVGLEGGMLFLFFENFQGLLREIIPRDLNGKFLFPRLIETIEETFDAIVAEEYPYYYY